MRWRPGSNEALEPLNRSSGHATGTERNAQKLSRPRLSNFMMLLRLLARPKRFELLTPRFVVRCSIGRVLDSRLIPEDGSPPRNETMRHEPDRHSPALDFERVDSTECAIRTLVVA